MYFSFPFGIFLELKRWLVPLLVLLCFVQLKILVEVAVVVASDGPDRHRFEVFTLKQTHHCGPLCIDRVRFICWIKVVAYRQEELGVIVIISKCICFDLI